MTLRVGFTVRYVITDIAELQALFFVAIIRHLYQLFALSLLSHAHPLLYQAFSISRDSMKNLHWAPILQLLKKVALLGPKSQHHHSVTLDTGCERYAR